MTDIVKSAYLHRQSKSLKRWKREWFVLYLHGELRYYESSSSTEAEGIIHMRVDCTRIKTGSECENITAPIHLNNGSLFMLEFRDGNHMTLCGESEDDMAAWQLALEQARASPVRMPDRPYSYPPGGPPPGYTYATSVMPDGRHVPTYVQPGSGGYYNMPPAGSYIYYGANGQPIYVPPHQQPQVIYVNGGGRYRYGGRAGIGTGLLAGAALGSLMWSPMWMGPCLWW